MSGGVVGGALEAPGYGILGAYASWPREVKASLSLGFLQVAIAASVHFTLPQVSELTGGKKKQKASP